MAEEKIDLEKDKGAIGGEAAAKAEQEKIDEENKKVEKEAAEKEAAEKVAAAAAEETGGAPKKKSKIQDAKDTLAEIKEQNRIMAENLEKAAEIKAEEMIAGRAPAGQGSLSEEERKDADARKLIEGSGFEDRIFPKKK